MLSRHNPLECRIVGMLAVFVEQLLVVDVIFVHDAPFENKQTRYIKGVQKQNMRSACVHPLLDFVVSSKSDYLVSKKVENI